MTTADFIIALFYRIDNQMLGVPKYPQAALYPSEVGWRSITAGSSAVSWA